jgi:hypothetical protein
MKVNNLQNLPMFLNPQSPKRGKHNFMTVPLLREFNKSQQKEVSQTSSLSIRDYCQLLKSRSCHSILDLPVKDQIDGFSSSEI